MWDAHTGFTLLALRTLFTLRTLRTGGALQCLDVCCVGGQQLGNFLGGSAILAGRTLLTTFALGTLFTLRTGGALQCLNVRCVGGQQLGDFLSGSAILASGALLTALALRPLFTLRTSRTLRSLFALRTGGALRTLFALRSCRTLRPLFALRKQHVAAIRQEERVTANRQHLVGLLLSDVSHIVHEDTHRNLRVLDDRIQLCQVTHVFSIKGVGHAHQLLHPFDGVIVTTFGIHFCLQKIGPHTPRDGGKTASDNRAVAHLQGHQTVGVGGHLVRFHVHGISVGTPQQDGYLNRYGMIGYQPIVDIANNGLVTHFLRSLGKYQQSRKKQNEKSKKFFHDLFDF